MSKNLNYYIVLIAISTFISFFVFKLTDSPKLTATTENNIRKEAKIKHPEGPVPGDFFNLKTWKLTIPVDTESFDGEPDEIEQPDLDNYTDQYFYYDVVSSWE